MPSAIELTKPSYAVIFIGPAGSGKTRAALSFPKVFAITFDPVGLEIIYDPANAKLKDNLVWHVPLNGVPLDEVFKVGTEPNERSLYGAIALAKQMKDKGLIDTVLIDGISYLADLKQNHVADDRDTRAMYRQLGGFLSEFFLQNYLPLATRHGLNVIMTCHLQRESKDTVEGATSSSAKALINQDSDLAAQIVGGFRYKIAGMPSAVIYLSHKLESDAEGKEILNYYAYCQKTFVKEWKSEVDAKNRYGLGARLKMTGGNFYKTLLSKLPQPSEAQPTANAEPTAKGATK